jgi:ferredoxin
MGVAALMALGLVITFAALSLLSGGFHFLFARPKLEVLKSHHGENGFAFSLNWNSARDAARFDRVKVRLFNPFGSPTQVEVGKDFESADDTFARDVFFGTAVQTLLTANAPEGAQVMVEVSSSKDGLSYQFHYSLEKFKALRLEARLDADSFNQDHSPTRSKRLFQTVERSFISEPLPKSGKALKLATNPEFAGQFAAGAGAAAPVEANYAVSKVWIDPGCIVCNACEGIYPEVFEVTDDSCLIRPGAPLFDGLRIQEAAEACPVEVIKFNRA